MAEHPECQECGGFCCAAYSTPCMLSDVEIHRIADNLEIPITVFKELYVVNVRMAEGKPWAFKQGSPCRFWTQGECGIHNFKPDGCSIYNPSRLEAYCSQYHRKEMMKGHVFPWWEFEKER